MSSKQLIKNAFTTSSTLIAEANRLGLPLNGVYWKDMLPRDRKPGAEIINLASSTTGRGTHWVCVYSEKNNVVYFDAFGVVAPIEVEEFIGHNGYLYNRYHIQNLHGGGCGSYCIEMIEYMATHKKIPFKQRFMKFLRLFNLKEPDQNRKILNKLNDN